MTDNNEDFEKKQIAETHTSLALQCREEMRIAWEAAYPKKEEDLKRYVLLNNQKKDPTTVGDTTLWETMQVIVASLYIDQLSVKFTGREELDNGQAENLNMMAEYDYEQSGKAELDYDWIWDTAFFGRGLMNLEQYHRDPDTNIFMPVPEIFDPISFLRDPDAVSINGKGFFRQGAARFYGRPVKMTKQSLQENPFTKNFDCNLLNFESKLTITDLKRKGEEAKNTAQNRQNVQDRVKQDKLGVNAEYDIIVWHTHFNYGGKIQKVKVWLGNDMTEIVGVKPLGNGRWRLIDRPLFPHAHDYDGTNIPDLVEDKQRARAVAMNLGFRSMKSEMNPNYLYDSTRITNRNDLKDNGYNKMIPVDGNTSNAIEPLRKASPNLSLFNNIYSLLEASADKAAGTTQAQKGSINLRDRPLGETNLAESGAGERRSLSAKVFGWSEKEFYKVWYEHYKENYTDVDEKVIRIAGAFGDEWRTLNKSDIITPRLDPDIKVESRSLSRARQLEERNSLMPLLQLLLSDPSVNRRYAYREMAQSFGLTKDKIDRLIPPTIDERIAKQENEKLNSNEIVEVKPEDDHLMHLEINGQAKDTPAKKAHILTHQQALSIKKVRPELFPDGNSVNNMQQGAVVDKASLGGQMVSRPITPSQTS